MADFNPFDNLFEQESLPPEHKREVMRTIDTLKLMADMANLFSVQQARTGGSVLGQVLGGGRKPGTGPSAEGRTPGGAAPRGPAPDGGPTRPGGTPPDDAPDR
jgi:hypothetical protein